MISIFFLTGINPQEEGQLGIKNTAAYLTCTNFITGVYKSHLASSNSEKVIWRLGDMEKRGRAKDWDLELSGTERLKDGIKAKE